MIQVLLDGVVQGGQPSRRGCCCHSFAACHVTVDSDLAVCFNRQIEPYVTAFTLGFLRFPEQPTSCRLHLAYFGSLTGCWLNSCQSNPQTSSLPAWNFFVALNNFHCSVKGLLLCVALFYQLLGNQWTAPGFLHERAKRARTHDWKSPTHHLTLTSLRQPGVVGSSPCTLTTSMAIPIPSSSSSNGPSN